MPAKLGSQQKTYLDHVFLWDAAVPSTALSSNPRQQLINKPADRFLNASDGANKITVLYNRRDELVLRDAYFAAKYSGLTLHNLPKRYLETAKENWKQLLSEDYAQAAYQVLVDEHRCLGWLAKTNPTPEVKARYKKVCQDLSHKLMEHHELPTIPALGFVGVEREAKANDELILTMTRSGKLISAKMSPYASGHSYMKIPSKAVMEHGYQYYIMSQKRGLKGFGSYDPAKFPTDTDDH